MASASSALAGVGTLLTWVLTSPGDGHGPGMVTARAVGVAPGTGERAGNEKTTGRSGEKILIFILF
jgi:hypothetical protein